MLSFSDIFKPITSPHYKWLRGIFCFYLKIFLGVDYKMYNSTNFLVSNILPEIVSQVKTQTWNKNFLTINVKEEKYKLAFIFERNVKYFTFWIFRFAD